MSKLFHDVDQMFDKNPFPIPSPFFDSFRNAMARHHDMAQFWNHMDLKNTGRYFPSYDIHSNDKTIKVMFDLPGVKLNDINVQVENNNLLHVTGDRKTKSEDGTKVNALKFEKRFNFDENVIDSSNITASFQDGVLKLTLAKLPQEKMTSENLKKVEVINGSDDLEC